MTALGGIRIALQALTSNILRAMLTVLGIVIGTASVITTIAIGEGAQAQLTEQIRSFGVNVVVVQPAPSQRGGVVRSSDSGRKLSDLDVAAISTLPEVAAAAPSVWGTAQIVRGNRNWNTLVNGTTNDHFVAREWGLDQGRFFSAEEMTTAAKVVILGARTAERLFDRQIPLGETVRVLNEPLRVIGVLSRKGPMGVGQDQDDVAYVPLETARLRLVGSASNIARLSVGYILVKATPAQGDRVRYEIEHLLRQTHHTAPGAEDDFLIADPVAAMRAQQSSTRTVTLLLAIIASVSLVVGGVSVMNVMLVSVTERTREIGLRLAVGARRRDIRRQFVTEAVTLCFIGGLLGIASGIVVTRAVNAIAAWPTSINATTLMLPISVSTAVGLFFGFYPALKASRLDPVTALRSE